MDENTAYNSRWTMQEVVPYLLKHFFGNRPTPNKDLSEAFWKLMGKNVQIYGHRRWTTGKTGVPYNIHRLTRKLILAEAPSDHPPVQDLEYDEYIYSYLLGPEGEKMIESFEEKYGSKEIEGEIKKHLAKTSLKKS